MSSNTKYGPAYQALRKGWASVVARGDATCSEPVCVMPTRHIAPGSKWHLSHDTSGLRILGPSHARCNVSEAAIRNNKRRAQRFLKL